MKLLILMRKFLAGHKWGTGNVAMFAYNIVINQLLMYLIKFPQCGKYVENFINLNVARRQSKSCPLLIIITNTQRGWRSEVEGVGNCSRVRLASEYYDHSIELLSIFKAESNQKVSQQTEKVFRGKQKKNCLESLNISFNLAAWAKFQR